MHWENYFLPQTVEDALQLLARFDGRARVVGGGTDYFVDDRGMAAPQALVDVTRIADLRTIRQEGDDVVIGCAATHSQIECSPLIQQHATALAEACGQIGGPQVRNVATLAGNIVHALPAADGMLALFALGAEVCVASWDGAGSATHYEWWPLEQAYRGPGISAIDSTRQVLVAVRFKPTSAHEGSAFARVMRPQGVALPVMAMAVRLSVWDGHIQQASIALGPVTPLPFRARRTETYLVGKPADASTLEGATEVLEGECSPRTSPHRATAEYRRELIPVLFRQAFERATARCVTASIMA
jgi:carbon-monoxide dehydrogenase medium subunit